MPGLQPPMCVVVYRLVWTTSNGFFVIFHNDILFGQIRLVPGSIFQCVCLQSGITLRDGSYHWRMGDMIEVGIGIGHAAEWLKCNERTAYRRKRKQQTQKKIKQKKKKKKSAYKEGLHGNGNKETVWDVVVGGQLSTTPHNMPYQKKTRCKQSG